MNTVLEVCVCVLWDGHIGACVYYLRGLTNFGGRGMAGLYSYCISVGMDKTRGRGND